MDESVVKLIVKASNQLHDDQTIECQSNWTVKQLKEHLCDVYPSKPKPDDQKLIYSGQLLKDNLILKDILRHYEGLQSQIHTFHLVYTPKYRFTPTTNQKSKQNTGISSSSVEGLRQRHNAPTNTTNNAASTTQSTATSSNILENNSIPSSYNNYAASINNNNCPTSPLFGNNNVPLIDIQEVAPNEYMLTQHVDMQNWMQQAYIQYMNQYMNLLSTGVRPETIYLQNQSIGTTNVTPIAQGPYSIQNFPFLMNTSVGPNFIDNSRTPNPPNAARTVENNRAAAAAAQNIQQEPPQPQQPRFPNLMNDDFQENRDWVDVFYSISRLMVLLTVVYLYSSPIRCFSVLLIGLGIYLYHTTYFRDQRQDNNNNGIRQPQNQQQQRPANEQQNVGGNNAENEAVDAIRRANSSEPSADANGQESSNSETTSNEDSEREVTSNEEDSHGSSMIAFLKTFVVSFIVSLLPETPPV